MQYHLSINQQCFFLSIFYIKPVANYTSSVFSSLTFYLRLIRKFNQRKMYMERIRIFIRWKNMLNLCSLELFPFWFVHSVCVLAYAVAFRNITDHWFEEIAYVVLVNTSISMITKSISAALYEWFPSLSQRPWPLVCFPGFHFLHSDRISSWKHCRYLRELVVYLSS